jgi:hypothetical protein
VASEDDGREYFKNHIGQEYKLIHTRATTDNSGSDIEVPSENAIDVVDQHISH